MQYKQDMERAKQAKLRKGNLTLPPSLLKTFSFQNLNQLNPTTLENFYQLLPEF